MRRSWKNVNEVFISYRHNMQRKCQNVFHAFSPTLKMKASEYYKSLSLIANPARHNAKRCVFPTCPGSILFNWRCEYLLWERKGT